DLARAQRAAAVELDDLAGEGEPKPGPPPLLPRRPDLATPLEALLLILRRDADAGVADRHLDARLPGHGRDVDAAALRCELDRIGQEIQGHLSDFALIAAHLTQAPIQYSVQGDPPPPRPLPHQQHGILEARGQ